MDKQREKLIELIQGVVKGLLWDDIAELIADYLLANGVIVPPCKVGDNVWAIRDFKGVKHPQQGVVSEMFFTRDMELMIVVKMIARGHWGKTVFLSREDAEKALEERKEK